MLYLEGVRLDEELVLKTSRPVRVGLWVRIPLPLLRGVPIPIRYEGYLMDNLDRK
jgi:hypothetical protein